VHLDPRLELGLELFQVVRVLEMRLQIINESDPRVKLLRFNICARIFLVLIDKLQCEVASGFILDQLWIIQICILWILHSHQDGLEVFKNAHLSKDTLGMPHSLL
jgi:hypothetical protein